MDSNKSHYNVLGVEATATQLEIRARYRELVLVEHPDKQCGKPSGVKNFQTIQSAWEVLRDPATRAIYDEDLAKKRRSEEVVVNEEIDIEDCEVNKVKEENEFSYPCRCGDIFVIPEAALLRGITIYGCQGCSLHVKVLFDLEESDH